MSEISNMTWAVRGLPLPTSISPAAQAVLKVQSAQEPLFPSDLGNDPEAWRAVIAKIDASFAEQMDVLNELPLAGAAIEQVCGRSLYVAEPVEALTNGALLDIHAGGLVILGGDPCRLLGRRWAHTYGIKTYSIDYRMPPDHPYPCGLDDCMAAYRWLLERNAPERIIIAGASAGGNLAAALMLRIRDESLPNPGGLVLLTPELDLTHSGDSFQVLRGVDTVLNYDLMPINRLYAQGSNLEHPHLSPLFGDVRGFPSTLLQAGTRDLFLSNAVRFHRALRSAGVAAELHVFEGMPHGGFGGSTPEDHDMSAEVKRFLMSCLGA